MDEKTIIKLIKNKQYSRLAFLEDRTLLLESENYYGFLYFVLDARGEKTDEILNEIVHHHGSPSKAYEYLGTVASTVFSDFDEHHIPASFFRLSTELDASNSNAWWGLYWITRGCKAFLESLKLDYINNDFNEIKKKLNGSRYHYPNKFTYSLDDWNLLTEIMLDDRVYDREVTVKLLIVAYYFMGKYEDGVKLINTLDNVDVETIKKYYNANLINIDTALSKIYDFQLEKLLEDDHERIYEEYIRRDNCGNLNMTKPALMAKAFRAQKFNDVIAHYKKESRDDHLFQYELEPRIYFLLSQLYLHESLDEDMLTYVKSNISKINDRNRALYKAFECRYLILELATTITKSEYIEHPISIISTYQHAEKLLEDSDLLGHYLYDKLYDELESLRVEWDDKYFTEKLVSIQKDLEKDNFLYDDFIELCHLGIHNERYDDVIEKVHGYHESNEPTITTYNVLGVCYERKETHEKSFEQYYKAIKLMEKYKEYNNIVISNYLLSLKRVKGELLLDDYNMWRERLNISLLESFKWDRFLASSSGSLYKFSAFNLNTLDSLINQYFYLPQKNQLNDPIEMPEIGNIGKEHLIDSGYRICSFSKNDNSMLMWSHYTQNHEGIMVEYQFSGELPAGVGIDRVKYTNGGKRKKEQDKHIFNQFLLTKNKEWSYEEEVRLMSYKIDKIYYGSYEYPNPDRSKVNARVVSITLGCNFPSSKMQLIMNMISNMNEKRKNHEPKVLLKQAKISESNMFDLEYVSINL